MLIAFKKYKRTKTPFRGDMLMVILRTGTEM